MHPSPAAVRRVQELARAALVVEAGGSPRPAPSPVVGAADLLAAAKRHRVTDLLHAHRLALGLEGDLGSSLVDELCAGHSVARRRVAVQVLEIGRLLELFAAVGLPVLVVKGPALAVQSAGHAAARGHGDIDLFVAPESVEAAHVLLAEHGWEQRRFGSAAPGSWAWRHLITNFNEVAFDGKASTVDLHWRLDPHSHALPGFAESWDRRAVVCVGGIDVPTLDPAVAFLHTCQHAAKDDWRWLRSLVDVHRLARLDEVRELLEGAASRSAPTEHVWATLAVTQRVLGLPDGLPHHVLEPAGGRRSQVRRAVRMQQRPARSEHPLPMAQSLRDLRYGLVVSRAPRAVLGVISATALPAPSLEGLDDRTAWTAVPKLLLRRIGWLVTRWVRWVAGVRLVPRVGAHLALRPRRGRR